MLVAGAGFPVRAADKLPVPLPAEPGGRSLDGSAVASVVADLDGDGIRELVRVVPRGANHGELAIDTWQVTPQGFWIPTLQASLRRKASVEEQLAGGSGPRPDADGMLASLVGDPAWLLVVRHGGREEVLVATVGGTTPAGLAGCCMTFWRVRAIGSQTQLTLVMDTGAPATFVVAADMTGDGDDEVLIGGISSPVPAPASGQGSVQPLGVRVFAWAGDTFELRARMSLPIEPQDPFTIAITSATELGDTDGLPGSEVGLLTDVNSGGGQALLIRIGMRGGDLAADQVLMPFRGFFAGSQPPPVALGSTIFVADPFAGILPFHWPADGSYNATDILGSPDAPLAPLAPVGSAGHLLLAAVAEDASGPLTLFTPSGLQVADVRPTGREAAFLGSGALEPYAGPLPGGLPDGRAAAWFSGQVVTASVAGAAEITPAAALAGQTPIGVMGPGGSWMVLARAAGFDASRDGGAWPAPGSEHPPATITVAPTSAALSPETNGALLQPLLVGAVAAPDGTADEIFTSAAGFSVTAVLPTSSQAFLARNGAGFPAVPESGDDNTGAQVTLQVMPIGAAPFAIRAFVLTPAGHSYAAAWHVRVLTGPPPLTAVAEPIPWWFEVPVSGTTDPDALVTVGGVAVPVDASGHFSVGVFAPPWPVSVDVAAVDPVGNRADLTLSVVGVIDYRQLPWIPIVVVLTVVAGLALYLGALRPPRPDPPGSVHEGTLEEIE